jgi:sulfur relay (sulfurtransferase) DsrF/TusC family protein
MSLTQGSVINAFTVVHLFGADKVYIHYGTFQFLSNAFITEPCVYDIKKVIICFSNLLPRRLHDEG